MCLRFVFLLITRVAAWLRLSRREERWKAAEVLILGHQLAILQRRRPSTASSAQANGQQRPRRTSLGGKAWYGPRLAANGATATGMSMPAALGPR
jgi:hypothetical protein